MREKREREARNLRARERRAAAKREAEREARREEAKKRAAAKRARERREARKIAAEREAKAQAAKARRAAKERAKARSAAIVQAQAAILRNKARKGERNARDRERRAKKRGEKVAEKKPPSEYKSVSQEPHPGATGEARVTSSMVLQVFREDLSRIAREVQGRWRTHVFTETGEIDGSVWKNAAEDMDQLDLVVASFGDAFHASELGLYYRETYFQGFATVVVANAAKAKKKGGSDLNQSRVGPDGKHYRTALTWWFRGDAQKCLVTTMKMIANVIGSNSDFSLVKFGINQYWSPLGRRPDR